MRVVVIGATGHIGTYLVPRLVALGHDVVAVSRSRRRPYGTFGDWSRVTTVTADREAEDADGSFGARVADLDADAVVDLICYTAESARHLAAALSGRGTHLVTCGSIWAHGPSLVVPTPEESPHHPLGDYGVAKSAIEAYLLGESRRGGVPATVVHPGHISGPGWPPINPAGNLDLGVFQALADGRPVTLPNLGLETLQHVHAADVADVFVAVLQHRSAAVGEAFHAVGSGAMTLRGYAATAAGWFGREADLRFLPFAEWVDTVSERDAAVTHDHLRHSPHCSMEKAARVLGVRPRYSPAQAAYEAVRDLVSRGELTVDR